VKTLRSIFGIVVVAAVLYAAWQVFPAFYAKYQLEEAMDDTAREGAVNLSQPELEMRDKVMGRAHSLGVPISPEQLQIRRMDNDVYIWGDYTVHVDLPLYPFDLQFEAASKSKRRTTRNM